MVVMVAAILHVRAMSITAVRPITESNDNDYDGPSGNLSGNGSSRIKPNNFWYGGHEQIMRQHEVYEREYGNCT